MGIMRGRVLVRTPHAPIHTSIISAKFYANTPGVAEFPGRTDWAKSG
jgi:hypothetical protein